VVAGSTRMKAGTATKTVLNMLSTAAMVRLGKVYDNLMVDVRPTSAKLRRRAASLVERIGGVSRRRAADLLDEAGGDTKAAIVMAATGRTRPKAQRLLRAHGGRLRDVLREEAD
jgi:N-acetylmuramic acid 6-phosphate etherase